MKRANEDGKRRRSGRERKKKRGKGKVLIGAFHFRRKKKSPSGAAAERPKRHTVSLSAMAVPYLPAQRRRLSGPLPKNAGPASQPASRGGGASGRARRRSARGWNGRVRWRRRLPLWAGVACSRLPLWGCWGSVASWSGRVCACMRASMQLRATASPLLNLNARTRNATAKLNQKNGAAQGEGPGGTLESSYL